MTTPAVSPLVSGMRALTEAYATMLWGRSVAEWERLCRESLKRSQRRRRAWWYARERRRMAALMGLFAAEFAYVVLWIFGVVPS